MIQQLYSIKYHQDDHQTGKTTLPCCTSIEPIVVPNSGEILLIILKNSNRSTTDTLLFDENLDDDFSCKQLSFSLDMSEKSNEKLQ